MTTAPLVSIIVPTLNSARTLEACLRSIKNQSYAAIELIVVDNFSTDSTSAIAKRYTQKFFQTGPERSAQRNFGASEATGTYVCIIDSDMELSTDAIKECVEAISMNPNSAGVIIPEESFGEGFWAQCKKLERSFYVGVDWMEAARFFPRELYLRVGGYDETMVSGEDWDLSQRMAAFGVLRRISSYIYHNEGHISLMKTMKKKYYYAKHFAKYVAQSRNSSSAKQQTSILARYQLFFSNPKKIFKNPLLGLGMLFMKTCELGLGGLGFTAYRILGR